MNQDTITKLNKLNTDFYLKTAVDFDASRHYSWPGWQQVWLNVENQNLKKLKILDLGCGNGRFLDFVLEKTVDFEYQGVDNNQTLLDIASDKFGGGDAEFKNLDILELLQNVDLEGKLSNDFNLIIAMGLIHHIPSATLRQKFIKLCEKVCNPGGIVAIAAWQFSSDARFDHKQINPQQFDIDSAQLEEGDYILDWQKGVEAFRYCHQLTEPEVMTALEASKLKLIDTFLADGKTHQLNQYFILKKFGARE